jgi:hypothetical protein
MTITPIQYVVFDDTATSAMGEAFDNASKSLRNFESAPEIVAHLIIAAAKDGERDPTRLCEHALKAFGINDMSMPTVSVGRNPPVPTCASVTHAAQPKRARLIHFTGLSTFFW